MGGISPIKETNSIRESLAEKVIKDRTDKQ